MTTLDMVATREQLMEDIDSIIDEFWFDTFENQYQIDRDDLIRVLCDAVCRNISVHE